MQREPGWYFVIRNGEAEIAQFLGEFWLISGDENTHVDAEFDTISEQVKFPS